MEASSTTLLLLPAEIRRTIFRLLIPHGRAFRLCKCHCPEDPIFGDSNQPSRCPIKDVATALFRVHTICQKETLPLLYGQNMFTFERLRDYAIWFKMIGPKNASLIRNIAVQCRDKPYSRWITAPSMDLLNALLPRLSSVQNLWFTRVGGESGKWRLSDLLITRAALAHLPHLTKTFQSKDAHPTLRLTTGGGKAAAEVRPLWRQSSPSGADSF